METISASAIFTFPFDLMGTVHRYWDRAWSTVSILFSFVYGKKFGITRLTRAAVTERVRWCNEPDLGTCRESYKVIWVKCIKCCLLPLSSENHWNVRLEGNSIGHIFCSPAQRQDQLYSYPWQPFKWNITGMKTYSLYLEGVILPAQWVSYLLEKKNKREVIQLSKSYHSN